MKGIERKMEGNELKMKGQGKAIGRKMTENERKMKEMKGNEMHM